MTPQSLKTIIEDFIVTLKFTRNELFRIIPLTITEGISKYNDLVRTSEFKNMPVEKKTHIYAKLTYLNEIFKLKVYSWNGG
jgi:predicted HAD superfamily hydrolase